MGTSSLGVLGSNVAGVDCLLRITAETRLASLAPVALRTHPGAPRTMSIRQPLAIDRTIELDINGSHQRIRMRAARADLPPLLIVQGGPALPLLHEVAKFERLLNLEKDFQVGYWEQRGCGEASCGDVESASLAQQVDDLRMVLQWLHAETKQRVIVLGISIGATFALRAVAQESDHARAVIAISPDSQTAVSDAAADAFLEEQSIRAKGGRLSRRVMKVGEPPYLEPAGFQRRASILADLGTIEYGKTFIALLREMLFAMIRTYGLIGTFKALRNMNLLQRKFLPEVAGLDLFANPPRVAIPVHYVFGERDALNPLSLVKQLPETIAAQ
jgi:pimeloyl-ACP methyl ester carboxylesterase